MKTFDARAEIGHYASGLESAVGSAEMGQLCEDMRLWIPDPDALFASKRVLDLGAGTGRNGVVIAAGFGPRSVVSLELVFQRLRAAGEWQQKLPAFTPVCGDAFRLPFGSACFDYVVANSVLHHLPDLDRATAEIGRVLRPGGWYIGREPNFNNPVVRTVVFRLRGQHLTPNEYPLRAQQIVRSFEKAGCRCEMHYFSRRLSWLRNRILSVAISVRAQRLG